MFCVEKVCARPVYFVLNGLYILIKVDASLIVRNLNVLC